MELAGESACPTFRIARSKPGSERTISSRVIVSERRM